MSEPAKDEADLVQCMAKAMHDSVYGGESAWMDVSKTEQSYREMEADAALAAIRAAGWAVVPQTELDTLRAENARLREALQWFVDNDETNEGDTPMPEYGDRTWNEINAYWIEGLNAARAALEVKP